MKLKTYKVHLTSAWNVLNLYISPKDFYSIKKKKIFKTMNYHFYLGDKIFLFINILFCNVFL